MLTIAKFMRLIFVGLGLMLIVSAGFAQNLNLQNIYVTDPLTGVAIEGYDAVSYYTQEAPVLGRPEYELSWSGVVWYFSNEANRAVFLRAPDIYAPQFGGHGIMSLSRGYLTDGKANIFALFGGRLFLFYSSSNKDAFMLSQRTAYIKARNNWEFLSSSLIPAE